MPTRKSEGKMTEESEKEILVVDDCRTTRKLLTYIVKSKGYKVVLAENGIEALEKLGQNTIALILTDLNMPQMNGLELAENVRNDDSYARVPIIMVTTELGENNREEAEAIGVNTYFVKPVTPGELIEEVEKYLVQTN